MVLPPRYNLYKCPHLEEGKEYIVCGWGRILKSLSSDDVTLELTSFDSFSLPGSQVRPCFELDLPLLDALA
ncbi:hypothetical protein Y032_0001g98 [Ancylostoma ceylanicum]|nr:hypothetical protein Y032_0001g98 [Ancylostoma ceylanicum]